MNSQCDWQPIDTAPSDGTAVLLYHPSWDMLHVGVHYLETGKWQQPCGDLMPTPTHWMVLPPPPRAEPRRREIRAG